MAPKNEPETKSSGTASDSPKAAARTYSGARGNRPQDVPAAARFRKETPEDAAREPGRSKLVDDEIARAQARNQEKAEKESKELEAAIRKANAD